jgi:hypothetical protein
MTEPAFTYGASPKLISNVTGSTLADRLKTQTVEILQATTKYWPTPARDGFEVSYCTYLPQGEWELLQTAHKADDMGLALAVLVHQCRGIMMDGEDCNGADGEPLTFRHVELQRLVGANGAHDAVRRWYIRDGDAGRVWSSLMRETGWDMSSPLDPTPR